MRGITDTDCLLRGIRDAVAAEGYRRVDAIALSDLACYASQIMAGGADERLAKKHISEFLEAGRAALEREAAV